MLIMGFGATHHCWEPQLEELLRAKGAAGAPKARVLTMDNRGVGRSGSPKPKQAYSTKLMATDVLCLIVGFLSVILHTSLCHGCSVGQHIRTNLTVEKRLVLFCRTAWGGARSISWGTVWDL